MHANKASPARVRRAGMHRVFGILAVAVTTVSIALPVAAQSPNAFGKPTSGNRFPSEDIETFRATRAIGWQDQSRSEVVARNGIAATSQPLATATALQILHDDGNAIDAAVAAAAVQGLTEPGSTGLGGDLFAIVWSARDQKLYALASSGWAPQAWTPNYFRNQLGVNSVPGSGINSAVVPGAVSGWAALLERFGSMTFDEVLKPAEKLAREGWPVTERTAASFPSGGFSDSDTDDLYWRNGRPPALYSIHKNVDMANAFKLLRQQGRAAFYSGPIAQAIVAKSQAAGGAMTLADLAEYQSEWVDPITVNYHGYDVHQLPPPGQGFAALEMLNIAEVCAPAKGINLRNLGHMDERYWHFLIEAKKIAYSDLHRHNGDPKFTNVPLSQLLSKSYAQDQCSKISMSRARAPDVRGDVGPGTVYLTTADRWGNMVSMVYSVFGAFGSGVTIPPYGFQLNNRGSGFTLTNGHPNIVAPRKRPFITIIAGFITKDGQPVMAFGNMGGSTQSQAHAQHVINLVDLGFNVQATTDGARFDHSQSGNSVSLDAYHYDAMASDLRSLGHSVNRSTGQMGGYQGIYFERDPELTRVPLTNKNKPVHGVYRGGSDHRKDGMAAGF
jgi:gamma-glutamyltranspeptidase / glutathione hydrolase